MEIHNNIVPANSTNNLVTYYPPTLTKPKELILPELNSDALDTLIRGDVLALRIQNYVQPDDCIRMSQALLKNPDRTKYSNLNSPLFKIGSTLFETLEKTENGFRFNPALLEKYITSASANIQSIAECCGLTPSLMTRLITELNSLNKTGCGIAEINGEKAFAGLVRFTTNGVKAHIDDVSKDFDTIPWTKELDVQLAANIYLSVPERGGNLQLWKGGARLLSRSTEHEYGVTPPTAIQPDHELAPTLGELVIFNTAYLHAVTPSQSTGERVNISCFIGVRPGKNWVVWS